jgi:hypothetical protein
MIPDVFEECDPHRAVRQDQSSRFNRGIHQPDQLSGKQPELLCQPLAQPSRTAKISLHWLKIVVFPALPVALCLPVWDLRVDQG